MGYTIQNTVGETLYTTEESASLKEAVEAAVLGGTNLAGARLTDADLQEIDLTDADLTDADLEGADLAGARLVRARLGGANLGDTDLTNADLTNADLTNASLGGAQLTDARLDGADLSKIHPEIRDNLWIMLSAVPREVKGLLRALREGRVNGYRYDWEEYVNLIGTIARLRQEPYDRITGLDLDSFRLIESFAYGLKEGHTPENNPVSSVIVKWIEEWIAVQPV